MLTDKRSWLSCLLVVITLLSGAGVSCMRPGAEAGPRPGLVSEADAQSFTDMLVRVSAGVGKVGDVKAGADGRRIYVLEEKHTSVLGQIEIALMLLRLHEQQGLRHILLEGLTKDKKFPDTQWFRRIGGPADDDVRNQILVGLLRDGELSAVELIALAFPDVVVTAADDPAGYAFELTRRGGAAGTVYLYKIGLKAARPADYPRIEQLARQKKFQELIEYVTSLDGWAKQRYGQLKNDDGGTMSVEQLLSMTQEIEDHANSVGAAITDDERSAMSEAKAFFKAAKDRSGSMVQTALGMDKSVTSMAMNIGAAHTEGVLRQLAEAKATYGLLTPASLSQNLDNGELSYEAYELKGKKQSVAWYGLGSLLDGRKKPPPAIDEPWLISDSYARAAMIFIVRDLDDPNFPSEGLRKKVDALDQVKVDWDSIKRTKGTDDVRVKISLNGNKGAEVIWAWGRRKLLPVGERERRSLEEELLVSREAVAKERGKRDRPAQNVPAVERPAPDVLVAFSKDPKALDKIVVPNI
jgi:hypothetical protein